MQSKLMITMSALALMMSQGMVFAHEGMDHDAMMEEQDSMMDILR